MLDSYGTALETDISRKCHTYSKFLEIQALELHMREELLLQLDTLCQRHQTRALLLLHYARSGRRSHGDRSQTRTATIVVVNRNESAKWSAGL